MNQIRKRNDMRTIEFNDEDIKQCKLASVNQNLTSLQSAFLTQHFNNIEQEKENLIKYLEDKIYSIQPKDCSINFFPEDGYDSEEDMLRANVDYNLLKAYQDILEKVKSGKYE
jgi:hypothetical protein